MTRASESASAASGLSRGFEHGFTALMLCATALPPLLLAFLTPPGLRYTWVLPPYPEDGLAYLAWTQQAATGRVLFSLQYTTVPHAPFLFQPFFLLAGRLAVWTGLDPGLSLLLLKGVGVAVFYRVFFAFLRLRALERAEAVAATLLVSFGAGLGGLVRLLAPSRDLGACAPADLWLVDLDLGWSLAWNPLFPFSLALLLGSLLLFERGVAERSRADFWRAGAAAGLLALLHPYTLPLVAGFALVWGAWRLRRGAPAAWARLALAAAPGVAYVAWQSLSSPLLARHAATGRMLSPAPCASLLGLGLPLLLALAWVAWKRGRLGGDAPLALWAITAFALAYAPLWYQRKLVLGVAIPVGVLAARPLFALAGGGRRARAALVALALAWATLAAATQAVRLRALVDEARGSGAASPYWPSADVRAALGYLRQHGRADEPVLASYELSRLIPALAGRRVVWGHWAQSVDLREQIARFAPVFGAASGWDTDTRARALWSSGIRHFVAEKGGGAFFPGAPPEWPGAGSRPAFENATLVIFESPAAAAAVPSR